MIRRCCISLRCTPYRGNTEGYLQKAKTAVAVEGNATGQLAGLIRREAGFQITERILHYTGLQMSVESVIDVLQQRLS